MPQLLQVLLVTDLDGFPARSPCAELRAGELAPRPGPLAVAARGLQLELNAVYQGLRRHPGLAGFSVHHYGSYRAMLERDRPHGTR